MDRLYKRAVEVSDWTTMLLVYGETWLVYWFVFSVPQMVFHLWLGLFGKKIGPPMQAWIWNWIVNLTSWLVRQTQWIWFWNGIECWNSRRNGWDFYLSCTTSQACFTRCKPQRHLSAQQYFIWMVILDLVTWLWAIWDPGWSTHYISMLISLCQSMKSECYETHSPSCFVVRLFMLLTCLPS